VVERILARIGKGIRDVMGQPALLKGLAPHEFTDDKFGAPTVRDILAELEKPGRDPRPEFRTATFQEGIESLADLRPGMILEGVVTNVAAFGAFVDVGVHQDGLVHVSALSHRFVKDPHQVVKPGQIVKVRVLEVDLKRQRIALTMRLEESPAAAPAGAHSRGGAQQRRAPANERQAKPQSAERQPKPQPVERQPKPQPQTAMALALARLKR
jgi:uncharacterized protein